MTITQVLKVLQVLHYTKYLLNYNQTVSNKKRQEGNAKHKYTDCNICLSANLFMQIKSCGIPYATWQHP